MDETYKPFKQIEPLDDDELEKDLRFLYHNRTDTVDQFVDEAIPVFKYHVNEVIAKYQERVLQELTEHLRGEVAGAVLKVRREYNRPKREVNPEPVEERDGGVHSW